MAKTKVAPKKTISVAKLELQSALPGARLAEYVEEGLTRTINKRYFWTDSACVRNWVRSPAAYYKPFINHRIGEIQTLTESAEWRFVPGKLNVSDLATRSGLEGDPKIPDLWIRGPSFLQEQESEWPKHVPWMAVVEEIRSSKAHRVMHISKSLNWKEVLLNEENFQGLIKANEDQINWLKRCQEETFPEELRRLKKNKPVNPNPKLLSLSPILGKEGLIRIG